MFIFHHLRSLFCLSSDCFFSNSVRWLATALNFMINLWNFVAISKSISIFVYHFQCAENVVILELPYLIKSLWQNSFRYNNVKQRSTLFTWNDFESKSQPNLPSLVLFAFSEVRNDKIYITEDSINCFRFVFYKWKLKQNHKIYLAANARRFEHRWTISFGECLWIGYPHLAMVLQIIFRKQSKYLTNNCVLHRAFWSINFKMISNAINIYTSKRGQFL